jgi:hypothetical protein
LDSIGPHTNPLNHILIPYTDLNYLKDNLIKKFPPSFQDFTILRDLTLQQNINELLAANQEQLVYEFKDVFKTEVNNTPSIWCTTVHA